MKPEAQPRLTVQCDFDNTIVLDNMSHAVLKAYASQAWESLEERYKRGEISVERGNQLQWPLVRASKEQIRDLVLSKAQVREGFHQFVDYCRESGIRLVVASNGVDAYLEPILSHLGLSDLEYFCGKALFTTAGIEIHYIDPLGTDRHEGFKVACNQYLRSSTDYLVYIGDGASDVAPALISDFVLARSTLAEVLKSRHHPFTPFETFHDVTRAVKERPWNQ